MNSSFPQGPINKVEGRCFALQGNDIDTDRIIPARFLKCIDFDSLGKQVFADDRKELNGNHPFDQIINRDSRILLVNENFGCGSSREHAPQALMRWGIRGIVGESFSEIFFGNCLAIGIPCVKLSESQMKLLQDTLLSNREANWTLDLNELCLKCDNTKFKFTLETGPLEMLRSGNWDATSQLVKNLSKINQLTNNIPYLNNFLNT